MWKFIFCLSLLCFYGTNYAQTDTTIRRDTIFNRDIALQKDTVSTVTNSDLPLTPSALERDKKRVYKLKPALDVPITAIASGWSLYAFTKIYDKDPSTVEKIESLNTSGIPRFDRWAADVYSEKAADVSDLFFYGSMPLPLVGILIDGKMCKDFAKLTFLYLEAMSVTGVLYTGSAYVADRYRPYAYNPEAPMDMRTNGNAKNSFFAGHVALVGTSTFFMAKIFSDYHPDSKLKWLPYTIASIATTSTAYLRHKAGRHFPSDILIGAAVGPLAGILIPHFHKNKLFENTRLYIMPFTGKSHGLSIVYTFDKRRNALVN